MECPVLPKVLPKVFTVAAPHIPVQGLKSTSEEYNAILDVMGRYAVYKAGVAMSCKRQGEARADLHTMQV